MEDRKKEPKIKQIRRQKSMVERGGGYKKVLWCAEVKGRSFDYSKTLAG
jgi:hypothetical protein